MHPDIPINYTSYSIERLKELQGVQMALEILYTKNNSLDDLDLSEGGGSDEDQAEFKKLTDAEKAIVIEINKRHALDQMQ